MADIRDWSQNAASNTDLFPEGMAPSAVNDGMRVVQAEIAQLNADTGGTLTLGGTATAYTLTLNTTPAGLSDGLFFSATANVTNTGGATTLVVTPSGGTAFASKKIKVFQSGAEGDPTAGSILANNHYLFQYDSAADAGTGAYLLLNPSSVGDVLVASRSFTTATGTEAITLPSGYDAFRLILIGFEPSVAGSSLYAQLSYNSGSTYEAASGAYHYAGRANVAVGTASDFQSSSTATVILFSGPMPANGGGSLFDIVISMPPSGFAQWTHIRNNASYMLDSGDTSSVASNARCTTNSGRATNIRFNFSAGNIARGRWALYGLRL